MLDKPRTGNRVYDFGECIRQGLIVLNLALDRSLHFSRLTQVVNLYVALRRGQKKLTRLRWMELAMRNYLIKFKYFLWRLFYHLVVNVATLSRLSVPI